MAYYAPGMKFCLFSLQSYFLKQQLDGQFVMNKMGIYFELNEKNRIKIALNLANLPIVLAANTVDVTSGNSALYSCATDSSNVNFLYKLKGCSNGIIGWGTATFGLCDGWLRKGT